MCEAGTFAPSGGHRAAAGKIVARNPRALLALLAALSTLPLLGLRDLWSTDETRYAQVAREILASRDWIVLHLNGAPYTEKPPLYFWCEALFGALGGGDVGPVASRMPSALAGIAGVLWCHAVGRRLLGARAAWLAALMLATSANWWSVSQRAALDMMLAACVWAGIACEEAARAAIVAGAEARATRLRLGFFFAMALGVLTKGPPALLYGGIALLARAWAARDLRGLARVPWLRGLALIVAVVGLWAVPWAVRLGYDDVAGNLARQTGGRIGGLAPHEHSPWFFLSSFPVSALPWTAAWLLVLVQAWRARRAGALLRSADPRAAVAGRYLGALLVGVLAVFSSFTGKRNIYLVPLLPAFALLTAHALERCAGDRALRRLAAAAVALAVLLPLGAAVALPLFDRGFAIVGVEVEGKSRRPLGEIVRREADAGRVIVLGPMRHLHSALYFSRLSPLETIDPGPGDPIAPQSEGIARLDELLRRSPGRVSVLVERRDARRIAAAAAAPLVGVEQLTVGRIDYVLLRDTAP